MESKQNAKRQLVETAKPISKTGWFDGKRTIPFNQMTEEHLQNAYTHCRKKEMFYHNRILVFSDLAEKLEKEAIRRNLLLREPQNEFSKNQKRLREITK